MNPTSFGAKILEQLAASLTLDEFFDRSARLAAGEVGANRCDLFLAEENDVLVLRASTHTPEYIHRCRLGRGIGICGTVFASGMPVNIPADAPQNPWNIAYPGVDEHDYDAIVVVPIVAAGHRLGVAIFYHLTQWPVSPTEMTQIQEMCVHIANGLRSFNFAYRLGSQSDRIDAVSTISKSISSSPYLEEILQLLVNITAQRFDYAVCTVRLLDEGRGELVLRATQAPAKAYQRKPAIRLGESIAGRAIRENRPIIIPDVLSEPDYIGHDLAEEQGLRSMICIPLMLQDRTIGAMSCYTTEVRAFSDDEVGALEMIAKQAAYSIEHAKLHVRNTLMQEMHHRVKNNLQQVASLIRLQMNHDATRSLKEALEDTLARILAISSVHDLLSRDDLDHVGIMSLAEALVQYQRDSLVSPNREIDFQIRGDDIHLATNQATQVALLLNELIQNAIEHGFRTIATGAVHITVEQRGTEVGLWVSNNGDPLAESFSIADHGHLGLKIADNLARSLGGRLDLQTKLGWTVAEIKFTRNSPE